jgi:hypothetical protein
MSINRLESQSIFDDKLSTKWSLSVESEIIDEALPESINGQAPGFHEKGEKEY